MINQSIKHLLVALSHTGQFESFHIFITGLCFRFRTIHKIKQAKWRH